MRLPRFGVRSLMVVVAVVALLIWGGRMMVQSITYLQRARDFGEQERGWRRIADSSGQPGGREFRLQCVAYFASLSAKYRHAMWHPWESVAPDAHAPGYDQWVEQESRKRNLGTAH